MNKFRYILLVVIGLLCSVSVNAQFFKVDGVSYKITSSTDMTVEVSKYGGYHNALSGALTIPESVVYNGNTYRVTSIGDWAFYRCKGLTSVVIPNSVTSIGLIAFDGCSSLTSVEIGNSVTSIGYSAFGSCSSLTSVEIPNSVTSIGNYAFQFCTGLISVEIPNSVTSIGEYAFGSCSSLTSVEISNSLTSIGNYAFYRCFSVTSVEIPNSVTSIGEGAFKSCSSLTSVKIPNSVTSIGYYAFESCSSLTSVEIPNSVTSIWDSAFRYCSSLTSVEIGNSVTSIGDVAFVGCLSLTSLVVAPDNPIYDSREGCNAIIKTSSNELLFGCKSTIIPNSVTSIRYRAFYGCSSLTSVEIPNSVTSIGFHAFYGCSGVTMLSCYAKVPPTCGEDVFDGIDKEKCVLQVPGSSLAAYRHADQWKEFLFIEDVLTSIGGVTVGNAVPATADVYSTNGMLIKRNAELKHLKHHLPTGIYIIGGKKVLVK